MRNAMMEIYDITRFLNDKTEMILYKPELFI